MHFVYNLLSISVGVSTGSYILYKFYEQIKNQFRSDPTTKVIFFTDANLYCRKNCLIKKKNICGAECSLRKLNDIIYLIDNAKRTFDVCIYLITCTELYSAIIRAFKRGVKVRLIIDYDMSSSTESKSYLFINEGIPVKAKQTNVLMHHKFCIIDSKILLTGSLNWTLQGLAGNFEYITMTSHPCPVSQYLEEFNRLWDEFSFLKSKHYKMP